MGKSGLNKGAVKRKSLGTTGIDVDHSLLELLLSYHMRFKISVEILLIFLNFQAPHAVHMRGGVRFGDVPLTDTMISDGLTDAFNKYHMGCTGKLLDISSLVVSWNPWALGWR